MNHENTETCCKQKVRLKKELEGDRERRVKKELEEENERRRKKASSRETAEKRRDPAEEKQKKGKVFSLIQKKKRVSNFFRIFFYFIFLNIFVSTVQYILVIFFLQLSLSIYTLVIYIFNASSFQLVTGNFFTGKAN